MRLAAASEPPPTCLGVEIEGELASRSTGPPHGHPPGHSGLPAGTWRLGLPAETPQLINAFFVAVATILGTGILALPVKLAHCGLGPFLLSFTLVLLMQLATVCLMVDLLQRAHAELEGRQELEGAAEAEGAGTPEGADAVDENAELAEGGGKAENLPDLHRMGQLLLGPAAARIFDAAVVLHLLAAMVSYNLAGSEAYAELFGVPYRSLILPFWGLYSGAVLLGSGVIQPVISAMTVLKCLIFFVALLAVAAVGSHVGVRPRADWARAAEPFLISTFALGGVVNTMPVTYARLPFRVPVGPGLQSRHAALRANAVLLRRYRGAVVAGVVLCFILNIIWCACVLRIVPQTSGGLKHAAPPLDKLDISLEQAAEHGQVSTVPLVEVIKADPRTEHFHWVSKCVDVFIVISVSVSFVTLGTGLKHVLDGFAYSRAAAPSSQQRGELPADGLLQVEASAEVIGREDADDLVVAASAKSSGSPRERRGDEEEGGVVLQGQQQQHDIDSQELDPPLPCVLKRCFRTVRGYRILLYCCAFGLVLLLASADPEGFLVFIEVFGSLALNFECGIFISMMAWNAQSLLRFTERSIPLRTSRSTQLVLVGFTGVLFSMACAYDVLSWGALAMGWRLLLPLVACLAIVALSVVVLRTFVQQRQLFGKFSKEHSAAKPQQYSRFMMMPAPQEPRFEQGDRVLCNVQERWLPGKVLATDVEDPEDPEGPRLPYVVKTDAIKGAYESTTISAPEDEDEVVVRERCFQRTHELDFTKWAAPIVDENKRKPLKFGLGDAVAIRVKDRPDGYEQWVRGTVCEVWPALPGDAGEGRLKTASHVPYAVEADDGSTYHCHLDDHTLIRRPENVPRVPGKAISKRFEDRPLPDGGVEKFDHATLRGKKVVEDSDSE